MPKRHSLLLAAAAVLLGCAAAISQSGACSAFIARALSDLAEHCADFQRDSICYGHPELEVEFSAAQFPLDSPGDRGSLASLRRASTSGLDGAGERWGLALLHLGANMPLTYEGPGVLILLAGEAAIINEIDLRQVVRISEPLSTVALVEATRYRRPGVLPEPIARLAADELLLVDAYDSSGDWLRVVTDGGVSWAESAKLARLKAMRALPRIGPSAAFPFQTLSLATGAAFTDCADAEPIIAIQTPAERPVSLTVNGVDMRIDGMVTFQQLHRNALNLTAHRGEAKTIFGPTARAGETMLGILVRDADGMSRVVDWSGALPAAEAEHERGRRAQAAINAISRANGWEERQIRVEPPSTVHVVGAGEGLYRIAEWHDTSVAGIVAANELERPFTLFTGQELIIPEPGSGFAGLYSEPLPTPEPEAG